MASSHAYLHASASDSRAPCPALNTLANHGYISRDGRDITFVSLLFAVKKIYNLSWPLAVLLTAVGFVTCGHISWRQSGISTHLSYPSWVVNLSDLSFRGAHSIAHDASLVHPNGCPSYSPDATLVSRMLEFAGMNGHDGLSLKDISKLHAFQTAGAPAQLDNLHEQVALGECGLAWAVMRSHNCSGDNDVIPLDRLGLWFGDECLPGDWWGLGGSRPVHSIGLKEARNRACCVAKYMQG